MSVLRAFFSSAVTSRLVFGVLGVWLLFGAASAHAATPPAWTISASTEPTNFAPGATTTGNGTFNGGLDAFPLYLVSATNVGGAATSGPVTVTDTLPAGVTPSSTASPASFENQPPFESPACVVAGRTVTCTFTNSINPGRTLEVWVPVEVAASATGTLTDVASVSGGGAATAAATAATPISSTPASFGFAPGSAAAGIQAIDTEGNIATQAGSHPYALALNFGLTGIRAEELATGGIIGPAHIKGLDVELPPGMVVNPSSTPVRCTETELESKGECPEASQIGVVDVVIQLLFGPEVASSPLYNMVAPAGVPAEFGFNAVKLGIFVHLMGGVNTGGNYALTSTSDGILARPLNPILGVHATLWGNPSDPGHDTERGECLGVVSGSRTCPVQASTTPLLTMPTDCSVLPTMSARADSWEEPENFSTASATTTDANGDPVGVTGCGQLDFSPSITVTPDTSVADSPSGLSVDLKVPLNESLGTLAEANLKGATVTLPAGVSVNPSAASGLAACTPQQIGIDNGSRPSCPEASKIGSVEVDTPLLSDSLKGGVYVALQNDNPFGSLLAIYVTAEADGALIKLAGHVVADPVTGQLTTTFENNPQLPFSDFKLDFFGGPRGVLATPQQCGAYITESSLSPWSGTAAVSSSDPFPIGSGCVSGFSPSFTAGTQNAQAGVYSPFVLSLSRADTDQNFSGLSVKLPEGMLAKLAGVQECSETQLAAADASSGSEQLAHPSCPAGSQVGTVETGAGTGPDPFFIGGKVYLTGPYKGGPYGLAVIVPAVAGPYDLGTVVVRQALYVDPATARVSDVSDPFPTILDGIPLRIRRVDVDLDRSDFTFNPTSCTASSVNATITSTQSAAANVSSRFQGANCASLKFTPKFSASTSAKTSKAGGASLTTQVVEPSEPQGAQANIAKVKVELPKALPSRLTTLQKACTNAQFEANPAGCPAASKIGTATVNTPVLPVPLSGPAIFVSHGGEAFPSLTLVLQGDGVTIDLVGTTFISKAGVTSTTFKAVPDAPFSTFALTLPEGKYSALAANGNLCAQKLAMPTEFIGQNGAEIHESTPITTEGCSSSLSFTHKIKKKTLTLHVYAPAAGKITATGKGLTTKSKTAKGQEDLTITLQQKHAGRLKTSVRVAFTPSTGKDRKKQTKSTKVTFKRVGR